MSGLLFFLLGSPLKLVLWAGNRLATWTGLFLVWRRLRGFPDRPKRFLAWLFVINSISLLVLIGLLRFLAPK